MNTTTRTRFDRIVNDDLSTKSGREAAAKAEVNSMTLDECMRAHTAFDSFQELLGSAINHGYCPTLRDRPMKGRSTKSDFKRAHMARRIADDFDASMAQLGHSPRAYRGR